MIVNTYLPHDAPAYFERSGLPYVTLTYAQTLDGCLALNQGCSSPISGSASMGITHSLRAAHDGILVGIGTVLADNPRLTARTTCGCDPQPIILDTQLRFPTDARLYDHPKGVWVATTEALTAPDRWAYHGRGVDVLTVRANAQDQIDLYDLLIELGKRNIQSVMVEGGARVITSFLKSRFVNRVVLTIAPTFAGGYQAVHSLNISEWQALPRLKSMQTMRAGEDLIVWGDLI